MRILPFDIDRTLLLLRHDRGELAAENSMSVQHGSSNGSEIFDLLVA